MSALRSAGTCPSYRSTSARQAATMFFALLWYSPQDLIIGSSSSGVSCASVFASGYCANSGSVT